MRMSTKTVTRYFSALALCTGVFITSHALAAAGPGVPNYSSVTDARLLSPEPQNWLHYRGNYNGWGYSPLDQINPQNVRKLQPVWTFSTGMVEGHQAPPFVNNGIMFVSTPGNQVLA